MRALSSDPAALHAVARAIAGVIAKKAANSEPELLKLDGLGRLIAMNRMADQMATQLAEEAAAAVQAIEALSHSEAAQ